MDKLDVLKELSKVIAEPWNIIVEKSWKPCEVPDGQILKKEQERPR